MIAYVDGEWTTSEAASVSVLDHGLLYGDGVFEGIRFYDGAPFELAAHLRRLAASARALALELPATPDALAALCREAAERTGLADGYLRLIVTRGRGALGVSPHTCPVASLILIAAPLTLYPADRYRDGVRVVTSSIRRAAHDALPPQVKSLNYLPNVLASIEARRQGADEALILNGQGLIAECTADNVFLVHDGIARTPRTSHGALHGITRQVVLRLLAELGIPHAEADLTPADAWTAEEAFLTGTGAEIVPVREIDGRPIGAGGRPVTDAVRVAFAAAVRRTPAVSGV